MRVQLERVRLHCHLRTSDEPEGHGLLRFNVDLDRPESHVDVAHMLG